MISLPGYLEKKTRPEYVIAELLAPGYRAIPMRIFKPLRNRYLLPCPERGKYIYADPGTADIDANSLKDLTRAGGIPCITYFISEVITNVGSSVLHDDPLSCHVINIPEDILFYNCCPMQSRMRQGMFMRQLLQEPRKGDHRRKVPDELQRSPLASLCPSETGIFFLQGPKRRPGNMPWMKRRRLQE